MSRNSKKIERLKIIMKTTNEVANLAGALAEDETVVNRVQTHELNTRLVGMLIGLRVGKGLSQRQIAKKMRVNPSKVCRMEAGSDGQLHWGDVLLYMRVLGVNVSLLVDDPSLSAAVRIKHHVLTAHALLEQLRILAQKMGEGEEIAVKIKEFYGEVLFNFMLRFHDSYAKLPQTGPINISFAEEAASPERSATAVSVE